jgi:hypothetical protein
VAPVNLPADAAELELELDPPLLSSLPQAAATSMSAAAIAAAAEALRTCTGPSSVVGSDVASDDALRTLKPPYEQA